MIYDEGKEMEKYYGTTCSYCGYLNLQYDPPETKCTNCGKRLISLNSLMTYRDELTKEKDMKWEGKDQKREKQPLSIAHLIVDWDDRRVDFAFTVQSLRDKIVSEYYPNDVSVFKIDLLGPKITNEYQVQVDMIPRFLDIANDHELE